MPKQLMVSSLAKAPNMPMIKRRTHLGELPTNIMIDRQGTVKLADFGMAAPASAAGCGGCSSGGAGRPHASRSRLKACAC